MTIFWSGMFLVRRYHDIIVELGMLSATVAGHTIVASFNALESKR